MCVTETLANFVNVIIFANCQPLSFILSKVDLSFEYFLAFCSIPRDYFLVL